MNYRLTVYLLRDRPDEARLIEAIEDVPSGSGRRQWLHDVLLAGFRKVGSYERWSERLRAGVPGVLVPVRDPEPDPANPGHSEPAVPIPRGPLPSPPHPSEDTEPCDTLNLL